MAGKRKADPSVARVQETRQQAYALETTGADASAAVELSRNARRRFLKGDCILVIDEPAAAPFSGEKRDDKVIDDRVAWNTLKLRFADRVNAAIGTQQCAETALPFLEKRLVLPVDPIDILPRGRISKHKPATNNSDVRTAEPGSQPMRRIGARMRVRIRQHDDFALQPRNRLVQHG